MGDAEWLAWIKTVNMTQLRQSLATRQELLHHKYVDERQEIVKEIALLKAEIKSRGK